MIKNILFFSLVVLSSITYGKGVLLEPEQFLAQTFENNVPKPDKIWIKKELKEEVKNILGHDINVVRIRYWNDGSKTAWILEETGRDKPITVGIVVKDQKIAQINVLVFRESRGWEVKYPFFTDQFKESSLIEENKLDRKIDGISGATLSVNALTKVARLALYLDKQINKK